MSFYFKTNHGYGASLPPRRFSNLLMSDTRAGCLEVVSRVSAVNPDYSSPFLGHEYAAACGQANRRSQSCEKFAQNPPMPPKFPPLPYCLNLCCCLFLGDAYKIFRKREWSSDSRAVKSSA